MLRSVLRASAAACGATVVLAALAMPAAADGYVPDGCAGSVVYACTGDATPSDYAQPVREVPITLTAPGRQVFPGTTIGGQQIGGVVIPLPSISTPAITWPNLGYLPPRQTGIVVPVQVCAFVTCIAEGTPVVIPGVTFPVVPVSVPSQPVAPAQTVTVPTLVTVPTESVPAVTTPAVHERLVDVAVFLQREDVFRLAYNTCRNGGGYATGGTDPVFGEYRWYCNGGVLDVPSDVLFTVYYTWPE